MKRKLIFAGMTLLLVLGLSSAAAHADDTIFFTLTHSVAVVGPGGDVVTYEATVSAPVTNGAAVNLNSDGYNFPIAVDDTNFFTNFPFFLNPGDSFTGDLFTVTIPPGMLAGDYFGTFSLFGGSDFSSNDLLGTVSFTTTVTPEPSSFLLLGTGLAGAFAAFKRRRLGTA